MNPIEELYQTYRAYDLLVDSRRLTDPARTLFFALPGKNHDGAAFAAQAAEKGAAAIVAEKSLPQSDCPLVIVSNARQAMADIASAFYSHPSLSLKAVGITGTNGKTTTTELCTHILLQCGIRTMASGNIGLPFAKAVRQSQNLDVMVLEVSSFQLETVKSFHPKVAAWLNFSPNHLDRYASADEYRDAKLRILENLTAEDTLVINAQSVPLSTPAKIITFSAVKDEADFTLKNTTIHFHGNPVIDQETTHLHGIHNAENIMAALGIGMALHIDLASLAAAIASYTPPVHRCEFVREMDGVKWINDSKATNLDAMQMAIRSQTRPLILIAGGKDKGFEFDENSDLVHDKSRAAILIGEMRHRIAASWKQSQCHAVDTLEEAVSLASELAQPGDTVLFSPGTSSFDMFRNYGERGNIFKSLVQKIKPKIWGSKNKIQKMKIQKMKFRDSAF